MTRPYSHRNLSNPPASRNSRLHANTGGWCSWCFFARGIWRNNTRWLYCSPCWENHAKAYEQENDDS